MARQIGRQECHGRELRGIPKPGEFLLGTAEAMEEQDQIVAPVP